MDLSDDFVCDSHANIACPMEANAKRSNLEREAINQLLVANAMRTNQ